MCTKSTKHTTFSDIDMCSQGCHTLLTCTSNAQPNPTTLSANLTTTVPHTELSLVDTIIHHWRTHKMRSKFSRLFGSNYFKKETTDRNLAISTMPKDVVHLICQFVSHSEIHVTGNNSNNEFNGYGILDVNNMTSPWTFDQPDFKYPGERALFN